MLLGGLLTVKTHHLPIKVVVFNNSSLAMDSILLGDGRGRSQTLGDGTCDRAAMRKVFDLWSATDVAAHGDAIAARLRHGSMPCDGPWPAERVAIFTGWLDAGAKP
jgi:hypothetical protein